MASDDVSRRVDEVRWSTERLLAALREPSRGAAWPSQPSVLPGWTRGHVLTHLARNADAMVRTLEGTLRGEQVPMYIGEAERDADIEAGSGRELTELIDDVATSAERLAATWDRLGPDDWAGQAVQRSGVVPALRLIGARWREVEIHRVDLDDGYGPGDWPASFVAPLLPSLLDPARLGPRLPAGLAVEVINTDSGQRWLAGEGRVLRAAGTTRAVGPVRVPAGRRTRPATVVRGDAGVGAEAGDPPPVRVVGPSWALVGWLIGRPSVVRPELGDPPVLSPWS